MKSILIVSEWSPKASDYAILRECEMRNGFVYMDAIRRREDGGTRFKIEHYRIDEMRQSELIEEIYSEKDIQL